MVQLAKFSFGKDWVPVKYGVRLRQWVWFCQSLPASFADVEVDVPHELDLTQLRGLGLRPDEELLPAGESPQQQPVKPGGCGYNISRSICRAYYPSLPFFL